jgi:arylsulfatase A-like enzyme
VDQKVASHWGGTRNGTIVHWPNNITGKGELRSQFHHVIDVAPTILEAAGLPHPLSVNGVQQATIEGVSMLYSFNDAKAPSGMKRSISRCSAIAALSQRVDSGDQARHTVDHEAAGRTR